MPNQNIFGLLLIGPEAGISKAGLMARGKYLSLEEARKKKGGLKRFAKEHPSEGDESKFDALLNAMASGRREAKDQTSDEVASSDCTGTRTPKGTSEDA